MAASTAVDWGAFVDRYGFGGMAFVALLWFGWMVYRQTQAQLSQNAETIKSFVEVNKKFAETLDSMSRNLDRQAEAITQKTNALAHHTVAIEHLSDAVKALKQRS